MEELEAGVAIVSNRGDAMMGLNPEQRRRLIQAAALLQVPLVKHHVIFLSLKISALLNLVPGNSFAGGDFDYRANNPSG